MQNTGNGGKVAIIGAIVTAIAGIITAIVSISGPLLDKRIAIEATQTREAVLASHTKVGGVAVQLTDTPMPVIPTAEVIEPTQAALSTRTTAPTVTLAAGGSQAESKQPQATITPSETMLKVGESWTTNGIVVKLTSIEVPMGNEVHLHFTFTNQTSKVMNISLDHNRDVTLTDDKGNVYTWASAFTWAVSIAPGTSRNDEIKRRGDVSRGSYFIVKLEIPGMGSAQWKH